ncbi:MAG: EamA family transporter [Chthoniobacterales bacterium]
MLMRSGSTIDARSTSWALFGFANPWFQIVFSAMLVTASELFIKRGAMVAAETSASWNWTGLGGLQSVWVWWGIFFVILSFLSWLYVLKYIPLTVAYPLSCVVHVFIPVSSWLILNEAISARRWCGIVLVLIGLAIVAKPVARIEERL